MGTRVRLSRVLGLAVQSPDGDTFGRILDLGVRFAADAVVRQIVVGTKRRPTHLVPWSLVERHAGTATVRLARAAGDVSRYRIERAGSLGAHDLFLRRDVLDSQVIELSGRRLCRVSDVILDRDDDGSLIVSAVDVGFRALLARMGLGRIGCRIPTSLVAWNGPPPRVGARSLRPARGGLGQAASPRPTASG